jgi:diketogulonate reductase-like aldo/keto reductase
VPSNFLSVQINLTDCTFDGLFVLEQGKPGEMEKAVKDAIDIGYRHFDSAMIYGNDHEVGAAVRAKIADGTVKRDDLFVTNKVRERQQYYFGQ